MKAYAGRPQGAFLPSAATTPLSPPHPEGGSAIVPRLIFEDEASGSASAGRSLSIEGRNFSPRPQIKVTLE